MITRLINGLLTGVVLIQPGTRKSTYDVDQVGFVNLSKVGDAGLVVLRRLDVVTHFKTPFLGPPFTLTGRHGGRSSISTVITRLLTAPRCDASGGPGLGAGTTRLLSSCGQTTHCDNSRQLFPGDALDFS